MRRKHDYLLFRTPTTRRVIQLAEIFSLDFHSSVIIMIICQHSPSIISYFLPLAHFLHSINPLEDITENDGTFALKFPLVGNNDAIEIWMMNFSLQLLAQKSRVNSKAVTNGRTTLQNAVKSWPFYARNHEIFSRIFKLCRK